MKVASFLFLGFALTAYSQTPKTNFVAAAPNFREVDGQLYNIEKSKLWQTIRIKNVSVKTNGTLVMFGKPIYDPNITGRFLIPADWVYEKEIFIKHCPLLVEDTETEIRVIKVKNEMVNTIESGPLMFETWDYGVPHLVPVVSTNQAASSPFDKVIEETKQRAIDHYNSASEVAYRKELEIKEHYDHLSVMNYIETGASQSDIDALKLRQQVELEGIKNRHEMREIEWQKEEDKWIAEHSKAGN
jgi:hypothetical protein